MKYGIMTVATIIAALSLPVAVHANEPVAPSQPAQEKPMEGMNCPLMGSMQKNMGMMMGDMDGMMQMMSDPVMKERMQKMHANMGAMMQQMMGMQKGMGGMMMQGGKTDDKPVNDAPAAAAPEANDPHHPAKQ